MNVEGNAGEITGARGPDATITALREHPRRAGRYVVEVAGESLGAVSVETIADLGLKVGITLTEQARGELARHMRATACFDKALDALARRARSRADLGRWLREREFTAAEADSALQRLEALGLLDDLAFARGFARTRLATGRGFGPRRVAAELARRGVARSIVDAVLQEFAEESGGDELDAAMAVAERRMRSLQGLTPEVRRRRLVGFLGRRGFSSGTISRVVRALAAV